MYNFFFFFFNDTATTEIYTLSLHDALPIFAEERGRPGERYILGNRNFTLDRLFADLGRLSGVAPPALKLPLPAADRKSTRLNSSHANISYAVFCLKKKIRQLHMTHINTSST